MSYKNWKAICQIKDTHFMWAMALLDLTTNFGQSVAERFPEYFGSEQQQGPIPLSVLRQLAEKDGREQKANQFDCLVSFDKYWGRKGQIGENLPIISFSTITDNSFDDPMLPDEIDKQIEALGRRAEVGDIFTWEGKSFVLMENNDEKRGSCFLMYFAPAELIAVDK